nr:WbqC family protein [Exiguobacterium qingdaonense]
MQPYYFPYLGYFQLMNAVDTFVILDDVQFVKRGWIHRNRILLEGDVKHIHMKIDHMTQHRQICEHNRLIDPTHDRYQLRLLTHAYKNAPYYEDVMPMIERIMKDKEPNVAVYLERLLVEVRDYLGLDTKLLVASSLDYDKSLKREHLVMEVCRYLNTDHYINAIGGQALYEKEMFEKSGVPLDFIKMNQIEYPQYHHPFMADLSIIDVMMFNSKEQTRDLLDAYTLI